MMIYYLFFSLVWLFSYCSMILWMDVFLWNLAEDLWDRFCNFITSYENLVNYSNVVLQQPLTVAWKFHCVTAHLSYTLEEYSGGMAYILDQVGKSYFKPIAKYFQGKSKEHLWYWCVCLKRSAIITVVSAGKMIPTKLKACTCLKIRKLDSKCW